MNNLLVKRIVWLENILIFAEQTQKIIDGKVNKNEIMSEDILVRLHNTVHCAYLSSWVKARRERGEERGERGFYWLTWLLVLLILLHVDDGLTWLLHVLLGGKDDCVLAWKSQGLKQSIYWNVKTKNTHLQSWRSLEAEMDPWLQVCVFPLGIYARLRNLEHCDSLLIKLYTQYIGI